MSMEIKIDEKNPVILQYNGEVNIEGKEYPFEVTWNPDINQVVAIDWLTGFMPPGNKLIKAEERIVQLVSKVIKEDVKAIIV